MNRTLQICLAMNDGSVPFLVQYFPGDCVECCISKADLTLNSNGEEVVRVSIMKNKVGQALGLKDESLSVFGLFSGSLINPVKLNLGKCIVDKMPMEFCFLRLAVNEEEEVRIISMDMNALQLIFWEVKFHYETRKIFPRPSKEMPQKMELQKQFSKLVMSNKTLMSKLTEEYVRSPSYRGFRSHSVFVEVVRKLPLHYLSYYYVLDSNDFKPSPKTDSPDEEGTKINLAVDTDKLIALDASGKELAASFWVDIDIVPPHMRWSEDEEPCSDDEEQRVPFFAPSAYYYSLALHFQRERRNNGLEY